MTEVKFLIIDGRRFRLVSNDGEVWWLFWEFQRKRLQEPGGHFLDYWRKKGVIEGEEEKED